jgi:hypothetical protein
MGEGIAPNKTKPGSIATGLSLFLGGRKLRLGRFGAQTRAAPGSAPLVVVITANNRVKVVANTAASADFR